MQASREAMPVPTGAALVALVGQFYSSNAYRSVSDPNISYVNFDQSSGRLDIGLAGYLNAHDYNPAAPNGAQVSEVVKLVVDGSVSYLYGFTASSSGLHVNDNTPSYTGNFNVSRHIPEPGMLGMVGAGLAAEALRRRRRAV